MKVHRIDVLYRETPVAFWTNLYENTLVSMLVPTTYETDTSRSRREAAKIKVVVSGGAAVVLIAWQCYRF